MRRDEPVRRRGRVPPTAVHLLHGDHTLGWQLHTSSNGLPFYFNSVTGESVWARESKRLPHELGKRKECDGFVHEQEVTSPDVPHQSGRGAEPVSALASSSSSAATSTTSSSMTATGGSDNSSDDSSPTKSFTKSSESWTSSMEGSFRWLLRSKQGKEMLAAEVQVVMEQQTNRHQRQSDRERNRTEAAPQHEEQDAEDVEAALLRVDADSEESTISLHMSSESESESSLLAGDPLFQRLERVEKSLAVARDAVVGLFRGSVAFVVPASCWKRSTVLPRQFPMARSATAGARARLHMAMETVEPLVTLFLSADTALSLGDLGGFGDQTPDVAGAVSDAVGAVTDIAGVAQSSVDDTLSSVGGSLGTVGGFFNSIVNSVTSVKDQIADATLGSVDTLKTQADDLGASALAPFQRLGADISQGLFGGLDGLKNDAQNAVVGAQSQLEDTVTESIGNPLQEGMTNFFSSVLGTSPEEVLKEEQSLSSGLEEMVKGLEVVATPSNVFYAENAAILPLWLGMIVWPEKPLTKAVMSSYATVIVAAVLYVWLTYEALQNPASLEGFASGITNLPGLTKGFGQEVSVAAAWAHFLAEDLFIGRWVYLDGQKNGIFTRHSLALCYLFGPIGFLSHLLTRTIFSVVKPGVQDIMKADTASPKTSPSVEIKQLLASAKQEAEVIVARAREEGAAQASSLLQSAETEALDILKGAEVERSALLKASNRTEPSTTKATTEPSNERPPSSPLPSADVASSPS